MTPKQAESHYRRLCTAKAWDVPAGVRQEWIDAHVCDLMYAYLLRRKREEDDLKRDDLAEQVSGLNQALIMTVSAKNKAEENAEKWYRQAQELSHKLAENNDHTHGLDPQDAANARGLLVRALTELRKQKFASRSVFDREICELADKYDPDNDLYDVG